MPYSRRDAMLHMLFGTGLIGLRSLVTGIPIPLLLAPSRAQAADLPAAVSGAKPQYMLFSTAADGDPINANVPGTYIDPNIVHSTDPSMAATTMQIGGAAVKGAQVWSTLPASVLNQMSFFHHASLNNAHEQGRRVLSLQGSAKEEEMLPSFLASALAPALQPVRTQPINFNLDGKSALYYKKSLQPALTPAGLAASLGTPGAGLGDMDLVALRDKTLDSLNAWAKTRGKAFQQRYIDQYAASQTQVRQMQTQVVSQLATIKTNTPADKMKAALILFKMNVTPVVMLTLPFGRDNHTDQNFTSIEVPDHKASIALLANLPQMIVDSGLVDRVSFCLINVFGRTLERNSGRDHNPNHAVSLIYGSNVKGSVVGGVYAKSPGDYRAMDIDSTSGAASPGGDIPMSDGLASFGKTVGAAAGLSDEVVNVGITSGKKVRAALA